ncbi:2-aminoethanethiol dioxygenase [Anolis sagrei]|uniref:2-aminoethanethiol dioxygenase n=1 Tax=Anolis sagrei TaxID=38937 RepID=UPI003520802D
MRRRPGAILGGGGGGGAASEGRKEAMPRDHNMAACLIQRVARQARLTFCSGGGDGPRFGENMQRLQELLGEVRAEDLRLSPRGPSAVPGPVQPPASYMHICETEGFSMGVFLLRAGARIPLHDHPGMHGLLKVLYGTLRIASFDALDPGEASPDSPPGPPRRRRKALLRAHRLHTAASPPCRLAPQAHNLHQIEAEGGPAAFLDILAPPYDPEHGRDCHYYRLLEGPPLPPPSEEPQGLPREVWLQEAPQAPEFWCGGEPYTGPRVSP